MCLPLHNMLLLCTMITKKEETLLLLLPDMPRLCEHTRHKFRPICLQLEEDIMSICHQSM